MTTPTGGIAILRALQLGDLLAAIPALTAVRNANPEAHVALVALPWTHALRPRYPDLIDEVIEFPGFPGLPEAPFTPAGVARFVEAMSARELDLAIQLHGGGSVVNPLVALFAARDAIGLYRPGEWQPNPGFVPYREDLSEVERLLEVTRIAGMRETASEPYFPLLPGDIARLKVALPDLEPGSYACLHPGSRDPRRRWSPDGFAAVADALAERGLGVVLTGVGDEAAVHDAVARAARHPVESLAGRLDLGAFGAALAGAAIVVSNDTGASHLAAAVGAPLVTVFVATDPVRWAPPPRADRRVLGGVAIADAVRDCCRGEGCPRHTAPAATAPDVAEVVAAADEVLRHAEARHAA